MHNLQGKLDRSGEGVKAGESFDDILLELKKGNPQVEKVIKEAAGYLGWGLVNLVNILNPNVIIIGDDLSKAGNLVLSEVRETVKNHVLAELYDGLKIELSSFTDDPVLLGISTLVIDKTFQQPSVLQNQIE
jgi:predicted NBD/HSP70 family sugar kinase